MSLSPDYLHSHADLTQSGEAEHTSMYQSWSFTVSAEFAVPLPISPAMTLEQDITDALVIFSPLIQAKDQNAVYSADAHGRLRRVIISTVKPSMPATSTLCLKQSKAAAEPDS